MGASDLAQVLFASALQASEDPSPDRVRATIEDQIRLRHADLACCAAFVAQEAGDHPEAYETRMRWALNAVHEAHPAILITT
ncbi:hypothetical protein [Streptosporangium lutulentum]|uniref:Uncharacterized protein n=1 Tax=Streptosporangium lutulentum TaxID=1461250 RepID=A0ABT9Q2R2_9ACTN|nr:hypothetical protein [Streptosporangium lutulentum]MDP9841018.1 hypothetical protein [Streptosporangium lutulentum]